MKSSENQDPVPVAKTWWPTWKKASYRYRKRWGKLRWIWAFQGYKKPKWFWQEEETVYRVTHQDPVSALKTAVSGEVV